MKPSITSAVDFRRTGRGSRWTLHLAGGLVCTLALCLALPDALGEEEKKGEEEVEILQITEEGIVFKDEEGKTVSVADFEQMSLEQLLAGEVVTTGAKREQLATVSLSTMSVVTRSDIDTMPYLFLGEYLATLPGMDVRWGKMERLYVGSRGLGGTALNSRMLLLWNGLPLNDPFTGELNVGYFVPTADIERIEVIRGAGSTLYGANAFSGVVNVLSEAGGKPFTGVRASGLLGSNLTSRLQAKFGHEAGPVHFGASVEAFRSDGWFPAVERFTEDTISVFKNDDAKQLGVTANVAFKGLKVFGRYVIGERGRPGTFTTDQKGTILDCKTCHGNDAPYGKGIKYPASEKSCGTCHAQPHDRESVQQGAVAAFFERELGKGFHVSAGLYHNEAKTSYEIFPQPMFLGAVEKETPEINKRSTGMEAHVSWSFRDINTIVVGGEFKRYEVASELLVAPEGNDVTEWEGAAFAEDELRPWSWLSLTGGFRYDYSTLFGNVFSPRGGIVVSPFERFAIRANVARAFRNPSFSELYVVDKRGRYVVTGKTDLSPEYITAIEGGISYTFAKPLIIRLSGLMFYNMVSDLISFTATGPDSATFFNIGEATVWGSEVEAEVEVTQKPEVKVFVNYSYQKAEDQDGLPLWYAPEHKVNGGIRARYDRFHAMVRARVVGERTDDLGITLPLFTTVDLLLGAELWGGIGAQLWATNLGDQEYQDSLGFPAARRSFYVTLNYNR